MQIYDLINFKYVIFGIAIIFLIEGCKEKNETSTAWVGKETIDFTLFKQNSWWLYHSTKNNIQDTWRIIGVNEKTLYSTPETQPYNVQYFELLIATKYYDTFIYHIENNFVYFFSKINSGQVQDAYFDNGLDFLSVCDNNKLFYFNSDSTNAVVVRKEFEMETYPCTNIFPKYFLWERNKGLTKMVYYNGDTLELLKHNLKQ